MMGLFERTVLLCVFATLQGCTPLMQASWATLRTAVEKSPPLMLSEEAVNSINYYQIKLQFNKHETLLALVRQQGKLQYWLSPSRQVVMMRDGLVVRTAGFQDDLLSVKMDGESPFDPGLHGFTGRHASLRRIDLSKNYRIGISINSELYPSTMETIEILDREYKVKRIDEYIHSPEIGYKALNRYWIDPHDGFIMKSIQNITPEMQFTITQIRPYRTSSH